MTTDRPSRATLALVVLAAAGTLLVAGVAADTGMQATADRTSSPDRTAATAWTWEQATEYSQDNDSESGETATLNVSVGAQLSTVIETSASDVHADVEDAGFSVEFETGDRAEAVADRLDDLRDRASDVRADYEDATADYEDGDISRTEYARQLASLHGEAERLRSSLRRLHTRASLLDAAAREEAGADRATIQAIAEDLDAVQGAGHRALLARFTGHGSGGFEFSVDGGLNLEVKNDDGEGFRTVRRSGDDSTGVTVNESTARETARDALSDDIGDWTLESDSLDEGVGEYRFEFSLNTSERVGGAKVRVDASSGQIVDLETGVASTDSWWGQDHDWGDWREDGNDTESDRPGWLGDDRDRDDWFDDRDGWFDGDRDDYRDRWTDDDDNESDDRGWLGGDRDRSWFGDDDDDTSGDDSEDDSDGENQSEGDESGDDESGTDESWVDRDVDSDDGIDLSVTDGSVEPGATVTLSVTVDGNATADVPVTVNGDEVGTTDTNGTVTASLPDAAEIEIEADTVDHEASHEYEFEPEDESGDDSVGLWGR